MTERVRIAVRWVVVAVLAVLALLGQRSASAPAELPAPASRRADAVAVPASAAEEPAAPARTAAAIETLTSGASCAERQGAVEALRAKGDPVAIPALAAAARADACVADAARGAIRALGRASRAAY